MIKKLKSIPGFFKEVKEEVKKVNWSTRQELFSAAVVVLIVSVLLTAYIFGIDTGLSHLVRIILG
ncbi:MAG: preprotein translocase subunit SecE [Candidatus Omnitrophota bacterium]|jgi:preprotein translocase SecE subunit